MKTLKRLSANFYWESMRHDIKQFVGDCLVCQQTKYETSKPSGLLQPLPIPAAVWEDISLDFVTGLPNSGGFSVLMVVVDRFSKYVHLGAYLLTLQPIGWQSCLSILCASIMVCQGALCPIGIRSLSANSGLSCLNSVEHY